MKHYIHRLQHKHKKKVIGLDWRQIVIIAWHNWFRCYDTKSVFGLSYSRVYFANGLNFFLCIYSWIYTNISFYRLFDPLLPCKANNSHCSLLQLLDFQTENVGQFYSNHIHGKTDNMDLYYHVNCYLTPPLHFELDLFLHDQKATT